MLVSGANRDPDSMPKVQRATKTRQPGRTLPARRPREPAPAGRRELNKLDKLHRIQDAARQLFISRGYDETTTREIAARAGVALGTIFTYAANKRDLLFLVMNEGLRDVSERAQAQVRLDRPLVENLLAALRPLYDYFARQPVLSRLVLREMFFYDTGRQARRFQETREQMIKLCTDLVKQAVARNEVGSCEDPKFVGLMAFSIYQVEIRRWLTNETLIVDEGMEALHRALTLLMNGLRAPPHRSVQAKRRSGSRASGGAPAATDRRTEGSSEQAGGKRAIPPSRR
jgi:AcrR family transcriptional regulator